MEHIVVLLEELEVSGTEGAPAAPVELDDDGALLKQLPDIQSLPNASLQHLNWDLIFFKKRKKKGDVTLSTLN